MAADARQYTNTGATMQNNLFTHVYHEDFKFINSTPWLPIVACRFGSLMGEGLICSLTLEATLQSILQRNSKFAQ